MKVNYLSKRLKELRESKGLTQLQLAESINIGRVSVSNYENGDRTPDVDLIIMFADFFGVSADYLLGRSEFKNFKQEYDYSNRFLKERMKYISELAMQQEIEYRASMPRNELDLIRISIDKNYSSLIQEISTGNERFRILALTSLDKLLKVIAYTGEHLNKYDSHDDDMYRYIEFLRKLKDTDLLTSDFGNIQANQEKIRGCTTCFNEFISFYVYSIIDFEKVENQEHTLT